MRNTFINKLFQKAKTSPNIWLLTGDLGFGVLNQWKEELPGQFLNAGVAEQNMTGMAAGLALDDRVVFTYSISNFPTFRCLEQIRNDVCYHNLDVKVVSVGAGVAYGTHGYTHFGLEDLAVMNALPNMKILCPADPLEAAEAVDLAVSVPGPCYVRLGKNGEPELPQRSGSLEFGKMFSFKDFPSAASRSEVVMLATGSICLHALEAAEELRRSGISVAVFSVPSIKPFPEEQLAEVVRDSSLVVTVEEHGPVGGLGSIVGETLSHRRLWRPHLKLSLPEIPSTFGKQDFLLKRYNLDGKGIYQQVKSELAELCALPEAGQM